MKRILTLALAALCGATITARASEIVADSLHSSILGATVRYQVYLPTGFDRTDAVYPVIYLLHGLYGCETDWQKLGHMKDIADEFMISGECREAVIVMPCAGGGNVHDIPNGYFNMPGWRYEDFFFQEFMPTVEAKYRCIGDKGHRAIMGLSMGGGGSTVYCERHPECFSSCYAMSGWLDVPFEEDPNHDPTDWFYKTRQTVHASAAATVLDGMDAAGVEALKGVKWFFDCGDDDGLYMLSVQMHNKMNALGIKNELRIRDGWHSWEYWHSALRWSLPFASRNFE